MAKRIQEEVTVTIDRPVHEVFAFMDDVDREQEWQPNLVEATQSPAGPTRVGTRKRYVSRFMKKRVENTYEVVMLQPNERVVYQTTPDSALQAAVEVTWAPVGEGTRITMRIDGSVTGPLERIPQILLDRTQRRELEASLDRLKNILEAGSG